MINLDLKSIFKASVFATFLFWVLILITSNEIIGDEFLLLFVLSYIPILIISILAYVILLFPFYLLITKEQNRTEIFHKFFPLFSIGIFGICIFLTVLSNFDEIVISITTTAFFTAIFSWIWTFKPLKK